MEDLAPLLAVPPREAELLDGGGDDGGRLPLRDPLVLAVPPPVAVQAGCPREARVRGERRNKWPGLS